MTNLAISVEKGNSAFNSPWIDREGAADEKGAEEKSLNAAEKGKTEEKVIYRHWSRLG